ncbi:MAG: glycosyltransferase family 2 protein [Bacteroidetes bacterium]|nr:glycosyltransferase family 2 protein [Bacteroidota bacterium]
MEPIKLSIVIPVYNSEDCLMELNTQVEKALSNFPSYELILVNDRSSDNSWQKITEVCEKNKKALGVSLRKNSGQDNAIMAGLKIAKGDHIVIMDDDLQHSPQDILTIYNECIKGYDICYAFFPRKKQKLWKNIGSWINGKLSEKLLSKPKEIYLSPFKVLRKEIALEMIKYAGPYPYVDALLLTITHNVSQISIEHHTRYKGHGNFSLFRSMNVFLKHATGYSIYPLRLAVYLGFLSALIAFIFGAYFLIDYFIGGNKIEGWISTILLILLLGGSILICLGIIGEYIGRIFLTINKKPQYTIEKITGNPTTNTDVITK